jgi:hypothetical protein
MSGQLTEESEKKAKELANLIEILLTRGGIGRKDHGPTGSNMGTKTLFLS